ncbi:MAG: ABC transporter substrate-binding protein [Rhizobiaceae bacterium]|nr:ABC transporter substrate-binding protein [Rhizobiaceae bacterium]
MKHTSWTSGTRSTLSRRHALRLGAAGLAATGAALSGWPSIATAQSTRKLTSTLSWIPNSQFSGLWMALEKGYFADKGIEVDWRPGGPNTPNPVERVASGEVQYGQQANPRPVLEAIARGNDFVVFGSTFQRQPGGLLSLAANPIKSPEDIVGKKIICPNPTDVRTIEVTLQINNLPNDFTYVPGGFDPQPLIEGQADAMLAFATSQPVVLENKGMERERDFFHRTWDDLGQPGYNNFLFAKREWLEENRQLVVDYLSAELRGWKDVEADPEAAARLTVEEYGIDFGLDEQRELRSLQLIIPFLHSDDTAQNGLFWIDANRLGGPIYDALRLGGLEGLPDVDKFLDMSILMDAHAA